ncbi:MAG: transcription elongation factor GreA [Candidatus Cloacimonetes bacterium]|nr:transcription elongation factor GreA [Candidatus Cloacimonadota bacterium]
MADYITKEGMIRLRKRMNDLIRERPEVIKQVVTAREMGDLSENAEYHAARERQRNLEKEYNQIMKRIEKLTVIDSDTLPKDAVRFGARVTIREISSNVVRKIRLVGIDEIFEAEDGYERVSVASPIGKPMIGRKIGDHYTVKAPIGNREFEIINIS